MATCLAGALCVVALIWLVDLRTGAARMQHSMTIGTDDIRQAANQLAVEWEARLALVESLQEQARAVLRTPPDSEARSHALADLRATVARRGAGIDVVSGIGRDERLLFTTGPMPAPAPNFAERGYFKAIFEDHQPSFAGMPVSGFATGALEIPFAEAAPDPDGTVNALTVVSVPSSVLQNMERYFANPRVSSVTLVRDDGAVLARLPATAVGTRLPATGSAFSAARETGFGLTRKRSFLDGVMRSYASRRIEGTSLFVTVGLDEDAMLAPARLEQTQTDWWAAALSIASLFIGGGLAVTWRSRQRAASRQARLQARLDQLALLNHIAGQATDLIALLDSQMNYVYCNEAYRGMIGRDPAELIGSRVAPQVIAEDRPVIQRAVAALAEGQPTQRLMFRILCLDGVVRWNEAEVVRLTVDDPDPRAPRFLVITRDVSARKQAEADLVETQDHVRALLHMGQGFINKVTLDRDGRRKAVMASPLSPEPAQLEFGANIIKDGEIASQTLAEDQAMLRDWYLRTLAEGQATVEFRYRKPDGTIRWRRAQAVLHDRRDTSFDVVVYGTDITAEREARQRLQLSERLATLGEVATHLAHEISQPVTTISLDADLGAIELDGSNPDIQAANEALLRIRSQTDRIVAIIDHIRQFARGDKPIREAFMIEDVLASTELLVQSKLRRAGITLCRGDMSAIGRLSMPRIPLEQVLMNLLSNACDAYVGHPDIPLDRRVINIAAHRAEGRLLLRVADQAGGIPDAVLERIFEPFFTTKAPGEGTGVGLAICRSILADLSGTITAENVAGGRCLRLKYRWRRKRFLFEKKNQKTFVRCARPFRKDTKSNE